MNAADAGPRGIEEGQPVTANAIARTAFGDMGNNPTFSDTRVDVGAL